MATQVRDFTSAGFDNLLIAGLINSIIPGGLNGSVASDATEYAARVYGVKVANPQFPESVKVQVTGDDSLLSVFLFQSTDPITFELQVGQADLDLVNQSQGTSIYTLGTYYDLSPLQPGAPVFGDFMMILSAQAKSKKSGSPGSGYHHMVLPMCQMTYRGRNFEEQAAATFVYDVTVNPTDTLPWNQSVTDANFGTTSLVGFEYFTENRITFATHNPSSSASSFLLDREPVAANRVLVWNTATGFLMNPTVTPATKTVAYTGATAGQYLFAIEEYA